MNNGPRWVRTMKKPVGGEGQKSLDTVPLRTINIVTVLVVFNKRRCILLFNIRSKHKLGGIQYVKKDLIFYCFRSKHTL